MKAERERQPRERVFNLDRKLRLLLHQAIVASCHCPTTIAELAKSIGITHSTLSKAMNETEPLHYCLINPESARRIAEIYGFSTDWPEWQDRQTSGTAGAARQDTYSNFQARYMALRASASGQTGWRLEAGTVSFPARSLFRFFIEHISGRAGQAYNLTALFGLHAIFDNDDICLGQFGLKGTHLVLSHQGKGKVAYSLILPKMEPPSASPVNVRFWGDDREKGWRFDSQAPIEANICLGDPVVFALQSPALGFAVEITGRSYPNAFVFIADENFMSGVRGERASAQAMAASILENLLEIELNSNREREFIVGRVRYELIATGTPA